MLGATVGAGEQGILAGQGKGPDAALDDVVVDLDAAVVEEQVQPLPGTRPAKAAGSRVDGASLT